MTFNALLAACEQCVAAGSRTALLQAVFLSAAARRPVPEWARVHLMRVNAELEDGVIADLNEAFGWDSGGAGHRTKRKGAAHMRDNTRVVLQHLWRARQDGRPMTVDTFEDIAKAINQSRSGTPAADVGRSTIEYVRRKYKPVIDEGDPDKLLVVSRNWLWDWKR